MVSKENYYARKSAGLCTKCAKPLGDSPSKVRCLECYNKVSKKIITEEVLLESSQKAELASLKKKALLAKTEDNKVCGLCGETHNSFSLFCQKCIKITVFSKFDAMSRYGSICSTCKESNLDKLKVVSADVGVMMEHKDYALFKVICYRRNPPEEYKLQCHSCYWDDNLSYVKSLKSIFETNGVFDESLD